MGEFETLKRFTVDTGCPWLGSVNIGTLRGTMESNGVYDVK